MVCVIFKFRHGPKERKRDRTVPESSTIRLLNVEVPVHSQGSTCAISCRQNSFHVLRNHVVSYSVNAAISLLYNATVPHLPKN